ncbi:hypothetical protein CsSME_00042142 [Camellia sinensis var. sinensis]
MVFTVMTMALAATTSIPTTAMARNTKRQVEGRNTKRQVEGPHFECWRYVSRVEGCHEDLRRSLNERRIRLGLDCCKAIKGLGSACFGEVFRYGPYSLLYGNAVKDYCSWIESPPSPPVYFLQSSPLPN